MTKTAAQRLMGNNIAKNRVLLNAKKVEKDAKTSGKWVITRQPTGKGSYKTIRIKVLKNGQVEKI